ncbi:MAG: hypothetical protein IKF90_10260 [Parasporobacterium sp.]|nr:hypothetical protein [Parasporobacterium sp.]
MKKWWMIGLTTMLIVLAGCGQEIEDPLNWEVESFEYTNQDEEMVSLDRKFRRLLSELVPSEDAALQEKYIHELQELRDIMNRIWLLLMANYDVKKAGKKGVSSDGND